MARPVTGREHMEAARTLLKSAKTANELRLAQSVLMPLELNLSIGQTALVIGRSVGVTCAMRTRFGRVAKGLAPAPRSKRALRNRANVDLQREGEILDEVLADAATGGVVVIPRLKPAIEARLGKAVALSSIYRMLARHGWRKLAPDTRHPQGAPQAREEWKKNSSASWTKS